MFMNRSRGLRLPSRSCSPSSFGQGLAHKPMFSGRMLTVGARVHQQVPRRWVFRRTPIHRAPSMSNHSSYRESPGRALNFCQWSSVCCVSKMRSLLSPLTPFGGRQISIPSLFFDRPSPIRPNCVFFPPPPPQTYDFRFCLDPLLLAYIREAGRNAWERGIILAWRLFRRRSCRSLTGSALSPMRYYS